MEGDINCLNLHGNHLFRRKDHFTGHEYIRESHLDTEKIQDIDDLNEYIKTQMPFDLIGFLNDNSISSMYDTLNDILQNATNWKVHPSDFIQWFHLCGRGARWAGKLTSMSSPSGLYANLLLSQPIIRVNMNLGVANRKKRITSFCIYVFN